MAIIFILIILQGVLLGVHFVFYKTLVSVFSVTNPGTLLTLKIVLGVLSLSFALASVVASRYYGFFARAFYTVSAVWVGFLFYFLLASLVYWLGVWIFSVGTSMALWGKILLFSAVVVGIYGLWRAYLPIVTPVKVELPNLPAVWHGKKAVWISDLHLGAVHGYGFAEKVASIAQNQHPDIVFIGGDLYDSTAVDIPKVIEPLALLHPPWGIYFITGNHEEFFDGATKYVEAVKQAGIKVLNNEAVDINGVTVIGVDYRDSSDSAQFENILNKLALAKNKPSILLKHAPTGLAIAEKAGISLEISGHTHRAQMFPLSVITNIVYKGFDYGLHRYGSMQIYTSDGVGTWGPPLRVGTLSEILLLEFK